MRRCRSQFRISRKLHWLLIPKDLGGTICRALTSWEGSLHLYSSSCFLFALAFAFGWPAFAFALAVWLASEAWPSEALAWQQDGTDGNGLRWDRWEGLRHEDGKNWRRKHTHPSLIRVSNPKASTALGEGSHDGIGMQKIFCSVCIHKMVQVPYVRPSLRPGIRIE